MSVQRNAAVVLAGCMLVALVGCSDGATPEYKQMRLENLNAAIEEFDAASLGDIVCEASGGEVSQGKGYTHRFVFDDTDPWQAIVDRFNDLGYRGVGSPPSLSFSRSDGIVVSGTLVEAGGDNVGLDEQIEAMGCEVPAGGYVSLKFEERGV